MKRLILLFTLLLVIPVLAQVPTPATNPRIIDSTGVATKHWQQVDFLTVAVRNVTFLSKTTTKTLRIALRSEDTVSTETRYQYPLAPGRTFTLGTTQRYAYIRTDDTAGTPTAAYSISNGQTAELGSGSDSSTVLLEDIRDTLNIRLASPYSPLSDSVGTAQDSWWNTVDLFDANPKYVEILNDASVAILFTRSATDTAASRTRYQKRVNASNGFGLFGAIRYIYVKSTSGAAAFRVGGY